MRDPAGLTQTNRLCTLGSLDLRRPDGREITAILAQPKRTAVLAYLALAQPPGFHRRDKLLAMFWPDLDTAHARNALNKAIHHVRTALGEGVVVSRGDEELGVERARLWCDATTFDEHLDAGRLAFALELYRGDLLDGFFVSDIPEFERWLEAERTRLRDRAVVAAHALSVAEEWAGKRDAARQWAQRGLALAPHDEGALRRLMAVLDAQGDRAGALHAYEDFSQRLGADLGVEPAAETVAAAEHVRAGTGPRVSAGALDDSPAHPAPHDRTRPRRAIAVVGLLLALTVGAGLLARTVAHHPTRPPQRTMLVVLPFENLGPPADAYLADGITDEITSRLSNRAELGVIARTSAVQYRNTTKQIPQIGRELGVDYVLEGTVRWERHPDGTSRVRVNPQLIRVSDATHVWARPYEVRLQDVLRLQASLAEQVARELNIPSREPENGPGNRPVTRNAEAYLYYLQGNSYAQRGNAEGQAARGPAIFAADTRLLELAAQLYERAVSLDSGFAIAWARLSNVRLLMWRKDEGSDTSSLARTRYAALRAVALAPDLPEAHVALAQYYAKGVSDQRRAFEQFTLATQGQPNNADALAALARIQLNHKQHALALDGLRRASALDPGSVDKALELGYLQLDLAHFADAAQTFDRVISLFPDLADGYSGKLDVYAAWTGDRTAMRNVLQLGIARIGRVAMIRGNCLVCFYWNDPNEAEYEDVLDSLNPATFTSVSDSIDYFASLAGVARWHGDRRASQAHADRARTLMERALTTRPQEPSLHKTLSFIYGALHRRGDAARELARSVELVRAAGDTAFFPEEATFQWTATLVLLGAEEEAIDSLQALLADTAFTLGTRARLRAHPLFALLQSNPRFRALVKERD